MKKDTILARAGRHEAEFHGAINPPVYHVSTIAFPTVAAFEEAARNRFSGVYYGRYGQPTSLALEEAVAALDGGYRAVAVPSGLAAIVTGLLAFVRPGDHVLVTDAVYGPTRETCNTLLRDMGVETTYFDPLIGADIGELIRPNTRLVYLESPGSLTFEVQDVPTIAAAARGRGLRVLMDNTWATPYYFRPLEHGVDVAILAATKYIGGHSDLMLGLVVATEEAYGPVKAASARLGYAPAPDDCYLALRGLRTLGVRLARHQANALEVASWLRRRPEVAEVLYPALPGAPGHELWARDFSGASGLFSVVFRPCPEGAVEAFLDGLTHFSIGVSWGGYESLALRVHPERLRTASFRPFPGPVVRFHIGLEDPDDLIADLEQGLARLGRVAARAGPSGRSAVEEAPS